MRGIAGLLAPQSRQWNDSGSTWFSPVGDGGVYVDEKSALSFSAVWACETLIADSIATLPVGAYRKEGTQRVEITAPDWLEHPHPEVDRVDYDTQRILSLLGWGNAYSVLGRSRPEAPVMFRRVIEPWRVEVRWAGNAKEFYVDGKHQPAWTVQHIAGHMAPGALCGMGVVSQARESLRIGIQADVFAGKVYENGVIPSGVLQVPAMPAEASKEVVDRLRDNVASMYGGPANARKPMVLTGGTTWQQLSMNPADAQFLETRKFQIEEVCRWFRVPPHKIQQITNNASQGGGAGLEQMGLEFAQDSLLPWTIRLERADSALLGPGEYVRYNLDAYARADTKTRAEVLAIKRQNGVLNADDWRALEDDAPIGGRAGSVYWLPVNMADANAEPVSTPAGEAPVRASRFVYDDDGLLQRIERA